MLVTRYLGHLVQNQATLHSFHDKVQGCLSCHRDPPTNFSYRYKLTFLEKEKKEPTDDTSKDVYSLLAQHVSGIIMPIVRRQSNTYIHAVHSARVPSTHYRSQHIQANTRPGFIYSVCLLMMGIIMPETC